MKARYIHLYIILLLCGVSDLPAQPTSLWIPPQYSQRLACPTHLTLDPTTVSAGV